VHSPPEDTDLSAVILCTCQETDFWCERRIFLFFFAFISYRRTSLFPPFGVLPFILRGSPPFYMHTTPFFTFFLPARAFLFSPFTCYVSFLSLCIVPLDIVPCLRYVRVTSRPSPSRLLLVVFAPPPSANYPPAFPFESIPRRPEILTVVTPSPFFLTPRTPRVENHLFCLSPSTTGPPCYVDGHGVSFRLLGIATLRLPGPLSLVRSLTLSVAQDLLAHLYPTTETYFSQLLYPRHSDPNSVAPVRYAQYNRSWSRQHTGFFYPGCLFTPYVAIAGKRPVVLRRPFFLCYRT